MSPWASCLVKRLLDDAEDMIDDGLIQTKRGLLQLFNQILKGEVKIQIL